MENKTRFRDGLKAWGGVFKVLLGRQEDNQMLKDLDIKKGIMAGFGYIIWFTFVLPPKILTFLLSPSWAWVHFVQKHLVSPMFELDALTGSESPSRLLGTIYENNLNHFKVKSESGVSASTLKPSIEVLERIMIFAKVRVIITFFIFIIGAMMIHELFDAIVAMIGVVFGFLSVFLGFLGMETDYNSYASIFLGMGVGAFLMYATFALGAALLAYLVVFAIRFFVESVRSIMYADREMMRQFVDDSLHYTIQKSTEIYGEEIALKAYSLLLENVVTNKTRYTADESHYKKLENKTKQSSDSELLNEE